MDTEQTRKGGALWIPASTLVDASREAAEKAHVPARNSLCFCCCRRQNIRLHALYTWPGRVPLPLLCQEDMLWAVFELSLTVRIIVQDSGQPNLLRKTKSLPKKETASLPCVPQWELDLPDCRKQKVLQLDTEIILPTSILSEKFLFPWPREQPHLVQKDANISKFSYVIKSIPGHTWMLMFLLGHHAPSWSPSCLSGYWCLWQAATSASAFWVSGFQMKEEHISGVQACPRIEGGITVTGKAALLSGELGWGRSKMLVSKIV